MTEARLGRAERFITRHIAFNVAAPEDARIRVGGVYVWTIEHTLTGPNPTSTELLDYARTAEQFGLSRHVVKAAHRFYQANKDAIERNLAVHLQ